MSSLQSIKPQSFNIDTSDKLYYNMKDLFEYQPEFFFGCTVKKRKIIERRNIPQCEYVYANYLTKTKEWNLSDESSKKAQLLFTKDWVDTHFFTASSASLFIPKQQKMNRPVLDDDETNFEKVEQRDVLENPTKEDNIVQSIEEPIVLSTEESKERKEEEVVENAPPILELEEEEKFKDINGNILEIEIRGERDEDNIFFKVQDIMKAFEMPSLDKTLREKTSNYERRLHYISFNRVFSHQNLVSNKSEDTNKKQKTSLYLTYLGLLRVLFNSRTGNAEHFQRWAKKKLFTIQMGTQENKEILGTNILNLKLENYRAVFGRSSQTFPCIYLLSLGKVGQLREAFGIDAEINDSLTVYKYGFTNDIKRRLGEHNNDYGKYPNVDVQLELFSYIDSKFTSEAEGDIREIFDSFGKVLNVPGRKELVALNPKEFDRIKKEYMRTGRELAGSTQALQELFTNSKTEIEQLKNKLILQEERRENEIAQLKLKHQIELQEEKNEKDKYKTRVDTVEMVSSLKEANYALKDIHNAQIQSLLEKIK